MNPVHLPDEKATLALASTLFRFSPSEGIFFLHGVLGAGKTTFVRGYLRAAGFSGPVKSPTFTLMEEYSLEQGISLFHFDLYRLHRLEELEELGIRDSFRPDTLCFIEWAERGTKYLPHPDLAIHFYLDEHLARRAEIVPGTDRGQSILARWSVSSPY